MCSASDRGDCTRVQNLGAKQGEFAKEDSAPRIGVLALQGDVEKHVAQLEACGATVTLVRVPADLASLDAIVLPGGETTTMSRLLRTSGLFEPLSDFIAKKPVLATCAGMILLAEDVDDLPYEPLGLLDIAVNRNAWGRQVFSFQEEVDWSAPSSNGGGNGDGSKVPMKAIFIRAPRVTRVGPGVQILAEIKGEPVALRQGKMVALSFHPELTEDCRVHRWFIDEIVSAESTEGLAKSESSD